MTIAPLLSARLLADAGFTARPFAPRRRCVAEWTMLSAAARAVLSLVDAVLAVDEYPDLYRDLWRRLDAAYEMIGELPEMAAETYHLERVLDALPLSGESPDALRQCLAAYETFLRREGQLAGALQVLVLGARAHEPAIPVAEFAGYALRAGRLNRLLARWDRAAACFAAAAEAGRLIEDAAVMLSSRLGRSSVYRSQGELPAARTMTEFVLREAGRRSFADVQIRAYGELSIVLRLEGACAEGLQAAYQAFQLSSEAGDRHQALRDVGLALAAVGAYDESRRALAAVRRSEGEHDRLLEASALIGLLSVESAVGDRLAFERWREEVEAARGRMPPGMAVAHRLKLGLGLARFGWRRRARVLLAEALQIARTNRLRGWCHEIEGRWAPVAMAG